MIEYYCGFDLGQAQDFSALVIAKKITQWLPAHDEQGRQKSVRLYHLVHIERLKLGTPYPRQVAHVKALLERPPLVGNTFLTIDHTGVGRPIFDLLVDAKLTCPLLGVSIHGGDHVNRESYQQVRVPKRDLVSVTQVLLQSARLKIAGSLPEASVLIREMLNFRVKIDPVTSHDSYSAWREREHDDLILATALALWTAEKGQPAPGGVKLLNGY